MRSLSRLAQRLNSLFDRSHRRTAASLAVFGALFWWLFPHIPKSSQMVNEQLFALLAAIIFWMYQEFSARSPSLGKHDTELLHRFLWEYEYTIKPVCKSHDMLTYLPIEVWDRLCIYDRFIDSERGTFISKGLYNKFEPFKQALGEFTDHFNLHGGWVQLNIGPKFSIRTQNELGDGPFSKRTMIEGKNSNDLATIAFEKAELFERYLRDEHPEIFDTVDYAHEFDTITGNFLYKERKLDKYSE